MVKKSHLVWTISSVPNEETEGCPSRMLSLRPRHRDAVGPMVHRRMPRSARLSGRGICRRSSIATLIPPPASGFFPLPITVDLMVMQAMSTDKSYTNTVARLNAERQARGRVPVGTGTGSYTKACARIPKGMLNEMAFMCGSNMEIAVPLEWRWHGKRVFMVDGSTMKMADTEANQAVFPQPRSQKRGLGFPLFRCIAVASLSTAAWLEFRMAPWRGKGTGEHALLRQVDYLFVEGDVVLGDAYFPSFFRLHAYKAMGVDGVFALDGQRKVDFRRGIRLGITDHLVRWKKPARPIWMTKEEYESVPDWITVREASVVTDRPGVGKTVLTVVTTFLNPKTVTKEDLADLYQARWGCELDIRSVKTVMDIALLRSKTPDMVEREVMSTLLAYNLTRQTICDAAIAHDRKPREISFKAAQQTINQYRIIWTADISAKKLAAARDHLLQACASHRVGNRPGRWEPRRVKERPKPHPRLTKPRSHYHRSECSNAIS